MPLETQFRDTSQVKRIEIFGSCFAESGESSPEYRAQEAPGAATFVEDVFLVADELSVGVNWYWLMVRCAATTSSTHVDDGRASAYRVKVDIEASARKHGVHDDDMRHAYRHHLIAFATNDESVTMFVGPSRSGHPLEVGVVVDDDGEAIVHAMPARPKFLKGWWTP